MTNQVTPQPAATKVTTISYQGPLSKEMVLTEHADIFHGLGTFLGPPMRFHLKEGYKAALRGIHKVPIHMEKGF